MKPGIYACPDRDCGYQTTILVERSEKELRCIKCKHPMKSVATMKVK